MTHSISRVNEVLKKKAVSGRHLSLARSSSSSQWRREGNAFLPLCPLGTPIMWGMVGKKALPTLRNFFVV